MLYLLDTNILVHFVRADEVWGRIRDQYQLLSRDPKPLISIVTVAELRSLAVQHDWGRARLEQMEFCLGYLEVVFVDNYDLMNAYVDLDAHFTPRGRTLGKNDLWIAATALVAGARLLTTDRDFDPLSPDYLAVDRVEPVTGP